MNESKPTELKARTFKFAVDVVRLTESIPRTRTGDVLARQLIRAATSVGANYRSARRAQSVRHMIAKLAIVEEEADEAGYWLELLTSVGLSPGDLADDLRKEASELTAIVVASKKTLKARSARTERTSNFVDRTSRGES
jgi:four helix bundle protein